MSSRSEGSDKKRAREPVARSLRPQDPASASEPPSHNGRHRGDLRGFLMRLRFLRSACLWLLAALVTVFVVLLLSMMPPQIFLKVGQVSPVSVKAPQEVIDEVATEALRSERAKTVAKVFDNDPKVLPEILSKLDAFKQKVASLNAAGGLTTQDITRELRVFLPDSVSDADIIGVVAMSPRTVELAVGKLAGILEDTLSVGVRPENLDRARADVYSRLARDREIPDVLVRVLSGFVSANLKPNLVFNQEETDKRIREALASVEPVRIRRGQFIVKEGDVVTEDQIRLLEKLGMMGTRVRVSAVLGSLFLALSVTGIIAAHVYLWQPELHPNKVVPIVSAVIILGTLTIAGFARISGLLAPAPSGVMLAASLVDRKLGAVMASCFSLIVGGVTGFELKYLVLSLAGGLTASLAGGGSWSRSHLVKVGLSVLGVNALVYASLGLVGVIPISDVLSWRDGLFVLLSGPLSSVLAAGSMPLFEMAFGIVTPFKLIELSNPEHPLLHRLLLEAPGTYHHSIMVGNLAEAAAWAIGADSLLARVGAYYHDIGKLRRPYLFSENQVFDMDNPHDKISPALSASIIRSHVKDGLDLAREYRLPEVISRFIAEHHGTTLTSFFYAKALQNQGKNDRPPDEWDYRYEGPRPSTKETAIVMLADSVEAAARSLSRPTPARIESTVRKIIHERLVDHQLDRSDLTLKELDTVALTFSKVLAGIFHTRVKYPERYPEKSSEKYPDKSEFSPGKNGGSDLAG